MRSNRKGDEDGVVRVELKYCERCGGLWLREGGAGVYCVPCRVKMEDLPIPKKKPSRAVLPIGRKTVVEGYDPVPEKKRKEFEAAGGVA